MVPKHKTIQYKQLVGVSTKALHILIGILIIEALHISHTFVTNMTHVMKFTVTKELHILVMCSQIEALHISHWYTRNRGITHLSYFRHKHDTCHEVYCNQGITHLGYVFSNRGITHLSLVYS